jgi:hypothetical protein
VQPLRRRKHRTVTGLSVYAAFLLAAIAWFAFYQFPQPSIDPARIAATEAAAGPEGPYTGTITIPRVAGGGCRQMKFDNNTGSVQEVAVVACRDGPPGANSTEDRMDAIKNAFSKR